MFTPSKVASCVVFYHPERTVLSNIASYYSSIDLLVVIDNSTFEDVPLKDELLKMFPNIIYRFLNYNSGIAAALNIGCGIALENNCEWILTMDQDSSFNADELSAFVAEISSIKNLFPDVGIISPYHVLHKNDKSKSNKQYSIKNIVMTSGNLLNLKAYEKVGPFKEELFMDYVDYEYCLRLKKYGFKVIQDNKFNLNHSLGNFKLKKLFGQKIGVSNHSSLRRYYMTRNSLYVAFKYFSTDKKFLFNTLKNIFFWDIFVILSFEKAKWAKLKSMVKGITHFINRKYGPAD